MPAKSTGPSWASWTGPLISSRNWTPASAIAPRKVFPSQPGTFFFDGATATLYVWCYDGANPSNHAIWWEYGVRPRDIGTVFDGAYAWDLDFTHPVKVAVGEGHSGWAWSEDGRELFVSQNDRNDWIEAYDVVTGARMQILYHGDFGWGNGWHFARMPASVPGSVLMSTYCGANVDWGDNQLFMLEMRDHASDPPPRVWRLGPTRQPMGAGRSPPEIYSPRPLPLYRPGAIVFGGTSAGPEQPDRDL